MNTINLLPTKKNHQEENSIFEKIKFFGLVLIAILILAFWEYFLLKIEQQKKIEVNTLLQQLDNVLQIEKKQKHLLQKIQDQQKIFTEFQALRFKQNNSLNLFMYLSKALVNNIYLTNIQKQDKSIAINGKAVRYVDIANFVNNLSANKNLRDIKVTRIKNNDSGEHDKLFGFEIEIEL